MSLLPLHQAPLRSLALSGLVLLCGLVNGDEGLGPKSAIANNQAECASAAITDVALDQLADVDEIRVQLTASSPAQAASIVTVETEDSDRSVEMGRQAYKSIHFAPAMRSNEFRISLFPGSMDRAPACVESVELLSKGGSVVVFRP